MPNPTPLPVPGTIQTAEEAALGFPAIDLWNLNKHTIRLLTKRHLQRITPKQFRNINYDQIRYFKKDQVKHLNKKIFAGKFEDEHLDHLFEIGKHLTGYMTKAQIRSLSPSSMKQFGLFFPKMSTSAIRKFSPSQVRHIDEKHFAAFNSKLLDRFKEQQIHAFKFTQIRNLRPRSFSYDNIQKSVQERGWIKSLHPSIWLSDFPQNLGEKILKASVEDAAEKVIVKHLEKRRYDDLTFNWVIQPIRLDKNQKDHVTIKFSKFGEDPEVVVYNSSISNAIKNSRIPAFQATDALVTGIYRGLNGTTSDDGHNSRSFSEKVVWNFGDLSEYLEYVF